MTILIKIFQSLKRYATLCMKPKFLKTYVLNKSPGFILDIGIANDSYLEAKAIYPASIYHGVDFIKPSISMRSEDAFHLVNLEEPGALLSIPSRYDLIIANHVLEHVYRGDEAFGELCDLLAPGGLLYVEVPSIRTAYSRKKFGNYHFHDDPTHRTFYCLEKLANIAIRHECRVISCGRASTALKDLFSPVRASFSLVRGGEWGPYMLHMLGKVDHILVCRE